MKKASFAIIYTVLLALFTTYVVLTTFVIKEAPDVTSQKHISTKVTPTPEREETVAPTAEPTEAVSAAPTSALTTALMPSLTPTPAVTPTPTPTLTPTWTENGYRDSNMTVTITKYREYDSDIYVVDAIVNSADLLKTQLSNAVKKNSNWEVVSDISEACDNLIISINGDCWVSRNGYSIKNGVLIRDSITKTTKTFTTEEPDQEDYVIFSDGSAKVIKEGEISAQELIEMGAWQLFNFGPVLIDDYKDVSGTSVTTTDVAKSKAPRTAIGTIDNNHFVFIVADGRSWTKELGYMNKGVTCYQLAEFGMKLGLKSLYNLDGGGSSTLYYNGEVMNNPCRHGDKIEESKVSDIVYIGY